MSVIFRKASKDDWKLISSLEKSVASNIYYPIIKEKEVKDYIKKSNVYIVEKDGKPIGTVSYEKKSKDYAYIDGLVVIPEFQNKGYGSNSISWLMKKLVGFNKVGLVTHPHNPKTIVIYLKNGFSIEGWKDDYFGDGEPRIILSRVYE